MTAVKKQPEVAPEPPRDELEHLDPQPQKLVLSSGTPFEVQPLKLRQFLALLRIITRGASGVLSMGGLAAEDGEAFATQLMALVVFAIPEAEDETVVFIKSMVKPADLTGDPAKDTEAIMALNAELDNPELEDVVTIIETVVSRESDDLKSLGKRLQSMFKIAEKMGLTKED